MSGPQPTAADGVDPNAALATLVAERAVIVCAGAGGVGKTTTAAALATHAAQLGRRAVVVTIDPAKRLADALGLDGLGNVAHRIEGDWPGELHALMLDTKATFDELVTRYASGPAQTERILANRFYRNISHALSGTQEYMAAEKLYELHAAGNFDLIVVDTPPTRQALDFLDAPGQLARFLDHRAYRLMTGSGRGVSRVIGKAGFAVLRTAGRLVGTSVMDDAVAFFVAFEGMEAGFRARSQDVRRLLVSPRTTFVVVASPQSDTVVEAEFFLGRLAQEGLDIGAVVANRVTPRFSPIDSAERHRSAAAHRDSGYGALLENLAELTATAEAEDRTLARLAERAGAAPLLRVPLLDGDVADLDGMERLRSLIFAAR